MAPAAMVTRGLLNYGLSMLVSYFLELRLKAAARQAQPVAVAAVSKQQHWQAAYKHSFTDADMGAIDGCSPAKSAWDCADCSVAKGDGPGFKAQRQHRAQGASSPTLCGPALPAVWPKAGTGDVSSAAWCRPTQPDSAEDSGRPVPRGIEARAVLRQRRAQMRQAPVWADDTTVRLAARKIPTRAHTRAHTDMRHRADAAAACCVVLVFVPCSCTSRLWTQTSRMHTMTGPALSLRTQKQGMCR